MILNIREGYNWGYNHSDSEVFNITLKSLTKPFFRFYNPKYAYEQVAIIVRQFFTYSVLY